MSIFTEFTELFEEIDKTTISSKKIETKPKIKAKGKRIGGLRELSENKRGLSRVTEDRNKNALRLRRTDLYEVFVELIKNCFEYGKNMEIIVDDKLGTISFNNDIKHKEDFKNMFGEKVEVQTLNGITHQPKSMSEYSFDDYKQIILDIKNWCMEKLQVKLPSEDEIE